MANAVHEGQPGIACRLTTSLWASCYHRADQPRQFGFQSQCQIGPILDALESSCL